MKMLALCLSALIAPSVATAATTVIRSPSAIVSNSMGEFAAGDLAHVIDQSGLSVGFASGVDDFDAYIGLNPMHTFIYPGFEWFSAPDVISGALVFDLGASYALPKLALWNEEFSGINSMTVSVSDSLVFGAAVGTFLPFNSPQGADYPAEVFDLGGAVGRYVKLDLRCPNPDFNYNGCSMGEIAFSTDVVTPAIPEPGTYALMALGLGVLGWASRRARRAR